MGSEQIILTPAQKAVVEQPLEAKIFLEGVAGAGKTTTGIRRLVRCLEAGIFGDAILVLVPQITLALPYFSVLRSPDIQAGGTVSVLTLSGLAKQSIGLFWPLVAEQAGFGQPDEPPMYLNLEAAQYYMAHLVRPLLEQGRFDSVKISPNRLFSQILDNLNKAALVGFSHTEIGERLKAAWLGEAGQLHVYDDVQECANLFRCFCLEHNFLDFSLQIEVFWKILWQKKEFREYLAKYCFLIYDNVEEDTPVAHDVIREWLKDFEGALLIYDWDAGVRSFLGADPQDGYGLKQLCNQQVAFETSLVMSAPVQALGERLAITLKGEDAVKNELARTRSEQEATQDPRLALEMTVHRFYPQMLDWVVEQIADLVFNQNTPAGEIVVLAPYLSDALRFSLAVRLEGRGIKAHSFRPSRSLREEPAVLCLLTLSALAHPQWGIIPAKPDVAYALMQAIEDMDLVRAQLLTEIVYQERKGILTSFDRIKPDVQERITYLLGQRFEQLRLWLEAWAREQVEFDHFLRRLFGELLSQPGFGFHRDVRLGEVTANLIDSVRRFRQVAGKTLAEEGIPLGKEYLTMVEEGLIAAQYVRSWRPPEEQAVFLAPAYTFLMSNRPTEVQFWLDVGSHGWSERLYQPLTHPYVLSRQWRFGRPWTDEDEWETSQENLYRLVVGLVRRCRKHIYLGLSEFGEQGYEGRGPLLKVFQRVLRGMA